MNLLKIALLQIAPCGALDGNLEKGLESCKQAKEMGGRYRPIPGNVEQWVRYIPSTPRLREVRCHFGKRRLRPFL